MTLSPERRGRVTASAVGGILGLSPYQTPEDVLRRMVRDWHGAEPEFVGNVATDYGTFHEKGAIQDYELETGCNVSPAEFCKYEDWLGATPDGYVGSDGRFLIEVKCPYGLRNEENPTFKTLKEQPHYYAQVQIELLCSGRRFCDFWQWTPKNYCLETVGVDADWLAENLPKLKAFHELFLSERDNPSHLEAKRKIIETQLAAKLLAEYDELCEAEDRASERKKEILAELVESAGGRDAEVCGRKLTKVAKEGAVSYAKALKAIAPDADLEPYRGKPSEFWKLT